ncbi:MAG: 5-(carboxyamino)imidazole ribonucleotide synthase [Acidobacteriota bacterium]
MTASSQPLADLGIVGGGQLARMTAERAAKLGLKTVVLDPSADCAAGDLATRHIEASFDDADGLRELVETTRVTTFDIEAGDAAILRQLESEGGKIHPSPSVLATIQDKLVQRRFLAEHGLPVPRFEDLPNAAPEAFASFGYPLVQKARHGGYDGRGVAVLRSADDLDRALTSPSMVEEQVAIARELAALVARRPNGDSVVYDIVELFPDDATHVLEALVFPAAMDEQTHRAAQDLGRAAIDALDGVGIFAVELFLDTNGKLWVNEISPRPHNAGHVTIEAAATCQFEQHLRAILDLPLGSTRAVSAAAMVNVLGPAGLDGNARVRELSPALEVPGARLHLYGKTRSWPGRKLGHLTVLDPDPDTALERAREARTRLEFVAKEVA